MDFWEPAFPVAQFPRLSQAARWTGSQEFSETKDMQVLHRRTWAVPWRSGAWFAGPTFASECCCPPPVLGFLKLLFSSSMMRFIPSFVNGKGFKWLRCGSFVGGVRHGPAPAQAGPSRSGLRVEFQVPFLPQQGSQGGTREAGVQRGRERDRPVLQVPSTCGARFRRAWSQICSQS